MSIDLNQIAVVTTFPNEAWEIYGKDMLQSFVKFWPAEIPLLVGLDNDLLAPDVARIVRPQDAVCMEWSSDHKEFVERNKNKDDHHDYRMQAVRFCHKVFTIKHALDAIRATPADENPSRYLIWIDADVITTADVTEEMLVGSIPKDGDAVAYLGRKDWDHSETGWIAFDLHNGGDKIIDRVSDIYASDEVFSYEQWHDAWIWDKAFLGEKRTDLTFDKPGQDIWEHSPMAEFSQHYKGPAAKAARAQIKADKPQKQMPIKIITKNSLPDEVLQDNIRQNQSLIKNWIKPCSPNDEPVVVVSAGPMLIPDDLHAEVAAGHKIVAVKHALIKLKKAGIKPWACILLDPRDHVYDFVENPDKDVIWLVASQVQPRVVQKLLDEGCTVWGYHASVMAGEDELIAQQELSIVRGGSASATRGLYLLEALGFRHFKLYGYDLCYPDKPDLAGKDDQGQPKNMEISVAITSPEMTMKRTFWTEPQLLAQFEEMDGIVKGERWNIEAFGWGMVPFIVKAKMLANLRKARAEARLNANPVTCDRLFGCKTSNPAILSKISRRLLQLIRRKRMLETSY